MSCLCLVPSCCGIWGLSTNFRDGSMMIHAPVTKGSCPADAMSGRCLRVCCRLIRTCKACGFEKNKMARNGECLYNLNDLDSYPSGPNLSPLMMASWLILLNLHKKKKKNHRIWFPFPPVFTYIPWIAVTAPCTARKHKWRQLLKGFAPLDVWNLLNLQRSGWKVSENPFMRELRSYHEVS